MEVFNVCNRRRRRMNYNYTASVVDNINMNCDLNEQKLGQKDMHNLTF